MNKPIRVVEGNAKPYEAFWQVRDAVQTGGDPEIDFIGYISEYSWMGDEVTPKKFKSDLYGAGKGGPITIRMHSGGGEIFAASAIRAMLLEYPGDVTVSIDGLCASAAVAIALAGNKIKIYDTAYMMVHNPGYMALFGYLDAGTLQKMADELSIFKDGLLNAYETRTGLTRDELSAMLDAETWMTAQKAVELGFADEVITGGSPIKKDLTKDVRNYVNVPPALLVNAADEDEVPETSDDGQEPVVSDGVGSELAQARRTANVKKLEQVKLIANGVNIMNMRQTLKDREVALARAQELLNVSDAEEREFTEAEQVEFDACATSAEELGEKIEKAESDRARVKALAEKKFNGGEAEKPESGKVTSMKRAEFNTLDTATQAAFIRGGGKVQD